MTDSLNQLYATILTRKAQGQTESSYVASLFAKGRAKIAQKVGEEATETVIAAMSETPEKLAEESADLLFHLAVLWAECGVTPDQVMDVLRAREGVSGIAEKASRPTSDKS
jgi:phosphoribosyl-ATP pyrophosphohydrolase